MDIKMLTKRYATPMFAKVLGVILFPAAFVLMLVLPVFELIPQDQYLNVFNNQCVAKGAYDSTQYTMFTMMQNDYHNGGIMIAFIIVAALCVCCGIFLLFANRPKMAAAPAALILTEVVFSIFRSPYKLYEAKDFFKAFKPEIADGANGFVHQYKTGEDFSIFNCFTQYWVLWIAAILLFVGVIVAIATTKTLIEKKK